jgi:hypothetical protein
MIVEHIAAAQLDVAAGSQAGTIKHEQQIGCQMLMSTRAHNTPKYETCICALLRHPAERCSYKPLAGKCLLLAAAAEKHKNKHCLVVHDYRLHTKSM